MSFHFFRSPLSLIMFCSFQCSSLILLWLSLFLNILFFLMSLTSLEISIDKWNCVVSFQKITNEVAQLQVYVIQLQVYTARTVLQLALFT